MSRPRITAVVAGVLAVATLQVATATHSLAHPRTTAPSGGAITGRPVTGPLSSRLAALAASPTLRNRTLPQQARALSLPARGPGSLMRRGDRLVVDVHFTRLGADPARALRRAGAHVLHVSRRYHVVTVAVPTTALRSVGGVRGVRNVQEVLTPMISGTSGLARAAGGAKPQTSAICPQGNATTEGDTQLRAADERAQLGGTGKGVTVGVLSDSYNRLGGSGATTATQDVAAGDLPGTTNPCGNTTPVNVLDDSFVGGEDEGRGMLQVVHDLAPDANLSFATAFTSETGFADNIRALKNAGAGVIVDDVTYFDEPFYQDGPVANAVNDVTAAGVDYYSSAANNNIISAGKNVASWEAPAYRSTGCPAGLPPGSTQCMNFNPSGTDNTYGITVAPGGYLLLELQWAQPWGGVTTDLDAYLQNSVGTVLASSQDNNLTSQEPFEIFQWTNSTGVSQNVNLVINRFTGAGGDTATPRLKIAFLENGRTSVVPNEYTTSNAGDVVGPTIFGHNGAANTVSVAAVPFNNSATVEYYSSRGPVTQLFGPVNGVTPAPPLASPLVLAKPDLAATDCGQTTFFPPGGSAPFRFCGTSEAAPHAAAIAALEKSLNPGISRAALVNSQKATARAVGAFGASDVGAGLIDALGATDAVTSRLSVALAGTGTGSVSSTDGKISCGAGCSSVYPIGASVTLVAAPTGGSSVTWSGCDATSGNQCTVGLGTDRAVTASFGHDTTPPKATMTAPHHNLQFERRISLAWSATDAGTGVKDFTVQVAKAPFDGGMGHFKTVPGLADTTATSGHLKGAYGTTYCFRVQARDNALNTSAFSKKKCVELPVDDPTATASQGWSRKTGQPTPSHTLSVTSKHGATLTLKNVHARRVGVAFRTCHGCGKVALVFDGKKLTTVSLDQKSSHNGFVLANAFTKTKTGTLEVRVVSHGAKVQIDGLVANLARSVHARSLAPRVQP